MNNFKKAQFLNRSSPPHVLTLAFLAALPAVSMSIFLPSLPAMTEHFETEYGIMQLSVAVYLFTNGILQIILGPLSDRYGRRPLIISSILLFLVATAGCIFSPTIEIFLAFRMAQAVIVAGIVLSRAAVRDMYPPAQAASMIGYITMGMAVAPMFGPAIGGYLAQFYGWQASFVLLLVFGVLLFFLCLADLGETTTQRPSSFKAQFREYPELFVSRRFWGYCATAGFSSGAFFAYLGGAPIVGTVVFGLEPAELGVFFGFIALGFLVGNFMSARFSVRFGTNQMVLAGALIATTGMAISLCAFLAGIFHPLTFFGMCSLVGVGNGLTLPNATAGMLSVRPHLAGSASGVGGAIMIGVGSGLSALSGSLLTPESGPYPLVIIMLTSSAFSLVATLYVIHVATTARMRAESVAKDA
ncbi:MAG: multidrug effflux MFS transporter [Albidovulum sp.]|nr:multidrug effflux MFS transporter [Albidovulum sp.]MDE0531469.1 multidrug effflux MFS transporter [Albidovulum sp.]